MLLVKIRETNGESQDSREKRGESSVMRSTLSTPNSPRRSGLSLTEVLISMGILTLGLLGVASVFPVGSYYMKRAEISDKGSAIAQSVMSDIIARGMLNPRTWLVMVPTPPNTTALTSPNYFFSNIDGKYAPVTPANTKTPSTFERPFAEALSAGLKQTSDPVVLTKQFGSAFVIDPLLVAASTTNTVSANNIPSYPFPATAYARYPWPSSYYYGSAGWNAWRSTNGLNSPQAERTWPIRRVTFQQATGWPLDKVMAESLCRSADDLSTDFPQRDDRPAIQTWETSSTAIPLARKFNGDYSWIVSVVPPTNAARDGIVRNPQGFAYDVSVVVFHKRALPTSVPTQVKEYGDVTSTERMVGAQVVSTGLNGGELLLTDMNDVTDINNKPVSPFSSLKVGEWIMLCGPHPNSNTNEPRFVLKWYQVVSIEGKESKLNSQGTTSPAPPDTDPDRRLIAVRGPEWPWQPATNPTDHTQLSNDLCVGIFRGAVAVHTKSIRLESPSSQGAGRLNVAGGGNQPLFDLR